MAITITEIRNAISLNDTNTEFELEINHPEYGWIPYALNDVDNDDYINNNDIRTLIGTNFTAITQEEKDIRLGNEIRSNRDEKLTQDVDPVMHRAIVWDSLSSEKQDEWTQYRLDLLNIPQQSGFPNSVTFPTKPE
jgi:hypothetical protein